MANETNSIELEKRYSLEDPMAYIDPDGGVWGPENAYYRHDDGVPYLLLDEDGEKVMTRTPLVKLSVDLLPSAEDGSIVQKI